MIPAILLGVHARLRLGRRSCRARAAAAGHAVALIVQIVERLLDEAVLEEETRRVAIGSAVIGIPGLVQRVAEDLAALGHTSANEDARQLAELHIGQAILAELKAAAIADRNAAGRTCIPLAAYRFEHRGQLEVLRLALQTLPLAKALGQMQRLVAQKVEYVAEEHAVAVQKVASLAVLGQRVASLGAGEQLVQPRRLVLQQRAQRRRVVDSADVQLDDFRHLGMVL